jgi:hypothetical protein
MWLNEHSSCTSLMLMIPAQFELPGPQPVVRLLLCQRLKFLKGVIRLTIETRSERRYRLGNRITDFRHVISQTTILLAIPPKKRKWRYPKMAISESKRPMITNTILLPQEPELLVDPNRKRDKLTLGEKEKKRGSEEKNLYFLL